MAGVAIVGAGCVLPDATSRQALWQNLVARRDSVSPATAADWGVDPRSVTDPRRGTPDRTCNVHGGWIREGGPGANGRAGGDGGLGANGRAGGEGGLGTLVTWPLRAAREALRAGGYGEGDERLARGGLVTGSYPWAVTRASQRLLRPLYERLADERAPRSPAAADRALTAALVSGDVAPLLARALGLGGPRYCIDAACATSLYALELARLHLETGAVDLMVVAAVSAADPLFTSIGFAALQALPVERPSRPFDADSDGLSPAQGACAFVLKREQDALRDGDEPLGVVRAIGLSSDGRGQHLLAPSRRGQILAYDRAYAKAGVDPATIDYVECHATGTRVGDRTELEGLAEFFGTAGALPLVGTVKSNLGHVLTVAGGAGLLKLLLALEHELIPPTIGVRTPLELPAMERLVDAATPWSRERGRPRRAAVNSFGFGGTNAHLVLEEAGAPGAAAAPELRAEPLAIVGMDAAFGTFGDLAALAGGLREGLGGARPLSPDRWRGIERRRRLLDDYGLAAGAPDGAFIDAIAYDALRYRLPPAELERLHAQHLLALQVGDRAIADAGLEPGGRVAVLVAMGAPLRVHRLQTRWELAGDADSPRERLAQRLHPPPEGADFGGYIGNLMASRIAELWDFSGPAFAVAAGSVGALRCVELAALLLAAGEADAVVVAAVDLAGDPESVLLRAAHDPPARAPARAGFDGRARGWQIGEGAGAVVLKVLSAARAAGDRSYAAIRAVEIAEGGGEGPSSAQIAAACRAALARAGVTAAEVGCLELHASGVAAEDAAEIAAMADVFARAPTALPDAAASATGTPEAAAGDPRAERRTGAVAADAREAAAGDPRAERRTCAVAAVKAQIGHTFAAAGLAGLVRAALCLHERYLPAVPEWAGAEPPPAWAASRLFVGEQPQPWIAAHRIAAVNVLGEDGGCAHAILAEEPARPLPLLAQIGSAPARVVALTGTTPDELLAGLAGAEAELSRGVPLATLSATTLAAASERPQARALCIVAAGTAEFEREAQLARAALETVAGVWQTPAGSTFVPAPVGRDGGVALLFPGMASVYPGLGRELLQCFPQAYERATAAGVGATLARWDDLVFARRLQPATPADREAFEERLRVAPAAGLQIPALFGAIATWVLRDALGLRPACALGYSLGELSMLFALGGWRPGPDWLEQLTRTEPLRSQLAGPRTAVRALWGLGPDDELDWASYVVLAAPERVQELIADRDDVYLSHVCAPAECIVSGRDASCRDVIARGGLDGFRGPDEVVVHAPPARTVEEELARLLRAPLAGAPECRLYVGGRDASAHWEPDALAGCLARSICEPADFPAGVSEAYDAGARVFVELGPGATCTRWVSATLDDRPHAALALDRRGVDDATGLARLVAALVAQRVPLDLRTWIAGLQVAPPPKLARSTRLGGPPLVDEPSPPPPPRVEAPAHARRPHPATAAAVASMARANAAHRTWLRTADRSLRRQADLAGHRLAASAPPVPRPALRPVAPTREDAAPPAARPALRPVAPPRHGGPPPLYGEADMLEFAEGRVGRVFGGGFAAADGFARRVRLPGPPFLAVSRVTALEAQPGRLGPGRIRTEFDIPRRAWYAVDGQVPSFAVDAQGLLFLLGYMGADLENRGRRVFRWLDGTITYARGLPREGQTIAYDIAIESFVRDGDAILFFSRFESSVDGEPLGRIDDCCAGFFTDAELERGEGITARHRARRDPVANSASLPDGPARRAFGEADLAGLATGEPGCFGPAPALSPSLRLPPAPARMIHRIRDVDAGGGDAGLGVVVAEQDLDPSDWYLRCHFKDDPVLGGPFMLEASFQILQFYALFRGLAAATREARFQPLTGRPLNVRFRGQIVAAGGTVTYRAELVEAGMTPEPYLVADIDVQVGGRAVGRLENVGLVLEPPRAGR